MNRAIFLVAFLSLIVSLSSSSPFLEAQQPAKVPRIGLLPAASSGEGYEGLRQGLRDLGYVEGQNILIVHLKSRKGEAIDQAVNRLIDLQVDVILAGNTREALSAKKLAKTVPVVFWSGEPVGAGIVANLERPGENITGITGEPESQHLQLLKQILPELTHVDVFLDSTDARVPVLIGRTRRLELATRPLGLKLHVFEVRDSKDIDEAFSTMVEEGAKALYVVNQPMFRREGARIADLAIKSRLAMMAPSRRNVGADGLLAYRPDFTEWGRLTAECVDKILRGSKPGDVPVMQSKFRLLINLQTASKLGLTIPEAVFQQADEVIR